MSTTEGARHRVLLPFRHLPWHSTAIALIAVATPICGTVLVLSLEGGHPAPALALTGLVVLAAGLLARTLLTARLLIDADGVRIRTPGRRDRRIRRDRVARAVVRSVQLADGSGAQRHLFLLDADDRPLLRMSDQWWTAGQLGTVARHFAVPIETVPETVHPVELLRTVPQHLAWTERHALATSGALIAAGAAACVVVGQLAIASL